MSEYSSFSQNAVAPSTPKPTLSTAPTATPLKRRRAKRSCDHCRQRKSRCDADISNPCSNCKAFGDPCTFGTARKKRGPPSKYVGDLEKRCKMMESLLTQLTHTPIEELEGRDFTLDKLRQSNSSPFESDGMTTDGEEDYESDENGNDHANDADDEPASGESDPGASIEDRLAKLSMSNYDSIKYAGCSAGLQQLLDDSLFKTKQYIPWPGRNDVVLQMMGQNELMVVRTERSASGRPGTRLDIGLSMRTAVPDGTSTPGISSKPQPSNQLQLPTRQVIDGMIDLYFNHFHSCLPIINKTRFLAGQSDPPTILVDAILAVAFRFAAQHFPNQVSQGQEHATFYFQKVMKRLRAYSRSRLSHVQASLLMTLYLDNDQGDVESLQWYTLGHAIRMAQDLGLYRSCASWNLPPSEIETRHRIFYACYILDRWVSARAGKPLTILDRDFDTNMPSPYEITDTHPSGPPVYRPFLAWIQLSEILGRVLKTLYAPNAKISNSKAGLDDPTILVVFNRRLKNWEASLEAPQDGVHMSASQKGNLLILYYTVVVLLHRPFVELPYPKLQMIIDESKRECTGAAANIARVVRLQKERIDQGDIQAYAALCLPTCFVYAMFQSVLVHLAAALKDRSHTETIQQLKVSIACLNDEKHQLAPAKRAREIVNMLLTIHGFDLDFSSLDNVVPSSPLLQQRPQSKKAQSHLELHHQQQQPQQIQQLQLQRHEEQEQQQQQQQQQHHEEKQTYAFDALPSQDMDVPKAQLFQRMMNTSCVGGISPDMHREVMDMMAHTGMTLLSDAESAETATDHYQHLYSHSGPLFAPDSSAPSILSELDNLPRPPMVAPTMYISPSHQPQPSSPQLHTQHRHTQSLPTNRSIPTSLPLSQTFTTYPTTSTADTGISTSSPIPPSSLNWNDWGEYFHSHQQSS